MYKLIPGPDTRRSGAEEGSHDTGPGPRSLPGRRRGLGKRGREEHHRERLVALASSKQADSSSCIPQTKSCEITYPHRYDRNPAAIPPPVK